MSMKKSTDRSAVSGRAAGQWQPPTKRVSPGGRQTSRRGWQGREPVRHRIPAGTRVQDACPLVLRDEDPLEYELRRLAAGETIRGYAL